MIQNEAARLVFNELKRAHVTSLSPCTGYQLQEELQLASNSRHWCLHIKQPQAQHPPNSTHYYESKSPPEVRDLLVSDTFWFHLRKPQNHSPEHSRSPFLAGGMIFPSPSGLLDPCQSSSNNWKLISFNTTWLHPKLKTKICIFIYSFLWLVLIWTMLETCYKHFFCLGVDRYVFFRADTDTDYYRSSRTIADILNRYTCLV